MNRFICVVAAAVTAITFAPAAARATSISVLNPSFEILPAGGLPNSCGAGCNYSNTAIPDWNSPPGTTGQFQPSGADFNYLPDGTTIAFSGNGRIWQMVSATTVAGVTYTLQVDVGHRKGIGVLSLVGLNIGGTASGGSIVGGTDIGATGTEPTDGNWSTFTATYLASATGLSISIIMDDNAPAVNQAGYWDNVRLSDDTTSVGATPLPAALPLFVSGLGALGLVARRRKKASA